MSSELAGSGAEEVMAVPEAETAVQDPLSFEKTPSLHEKSVLQWLRRVGSDEQICPVPFQVLQLSQKKPEFRKG